MTEYKTKLKIAETVIMMQSLFPVEKLTEEEKKERAIERFDSFFYPRDEKCDILVEVEMVNELPQFPEARPLYITYHHINKNENWRLCKIDNGYIYKSPLKEKNHLMVVNEKFDSVTAYILPKEDKGWVWNVFEIIDQFLQVLFIHYFALRKEGIIIHAAGIKESDGRGLVFAGKSRCGKTTMARLWHRYSNAKILNDDRIIVRQQEGKFFMYMPPWYGDFNDYFVSRMKSAPLDKLFFIHQSSKNTSKRISYNETFHLIYPTVFSSFWSKEYLENIVSFCENLVRNVPCYKLGFVNDENVIEFVRKVE
jgi:hypothetical protein